MLNQIFRFAKRKGYISDPPVMTSGLRGSFAKWLGARARQLLPERGKFLALLAHGFEQLSRVLRPQFHKLRRLLSAGDALTGLFFGPDIVREWAIKGAWRCRGSGLARSRLLCCFVRLKC